MTGRVEYGAGICRRSARKRPSSPRLFGQSRDRFTLLPAVPLPMIYVASSAEAVVEVTKSVRPLQVTFLPFAHRWPRMSGLTVSECVLPTQLGRLDRYASGVRFRKYSSPIGIVRFKATTCRCSVALGSSSPRS